MDRQQSVDLDRHITGNYGEDGVENEGPDFDPDELPTETAYEPPSAEQRAEWQAQAEATDRAAAEAMSKIGAAFRLLATDASHDSDAEWSSHRFSVYDSAADGADELARLIAESGI